MEKAETASSQNRIGTRLILAIVLCSAIATIITTSIQLYIYYKNDVQLINEEIETIRKTSLESLSHSVWVIDKELINIQLDGLLKHRDIEFISIETEEGLVWSAGNEESQSIVTKELPLEYGRGSDTILLGTLKIVASLDSVFNRLRRQTTIILISNGATIFIVAFFAFAVFQYMVTRHLLKIVAYTKDISLKKKGSDLHLDRSDAKQRPPDELDLVVSTINTMKHRLAIEQKKKEEDRRKYRQLLESTKTVPWELNLQSDEFTYIGPQIVEMLGYPQDSWKNSKVWAERMFIEDSAGSVATYNEAITQGEDHDFIYRAQHEDGSLRWIHDIVTVISGEQGPERLVGFFHDITELKHAEETKLKLEEQLRQSQKMEAIGTLAGGIAHDFNNILSAILGYGELAKEDLPPGSPVIADIDQVLHAGGRAKELVRQILTFSRKSSQALRPIGFHAVVSEALKLLRSSIPTSVEIRHEIDPESGTVLSNATQVHQVTMNLCTNAFQAMRSTGGVLAITLRSVFLEEDDLRAKGADVEAGAYIELSVSDTGIGMDKEILSKIFDPYFSTKITGEGTGLGLSVVHGIVKSYGGHIDVYSEPGKGTTFRLYFPKIEADASIEKIETVEISPTGHEHVLIVDDEEVIVAMVKRMLVSLGYVVTDKTSSRDALKAFEENPDRFDLLVTDMTMPNMNGAELILNIRRIKSSMPVVLCTGFSELIDKERAKILGVQKYLMKPIVKRDLAISIREALDAKLA